LEHPVVTKIITDGTTDRVVDAPRVLLPVRADLFGERARRFDQLAQGHAMAAYLRLMAELARAQQAALPARAPLAIDAAALEQSRNFGMPPLSALSHPRDAAWRLDLRDITARLRGNPAAAAALDALQSRDDAAIEALADRVLSGNTLDDEAAQVPFAGAALQVYFTRNAAALAPADVSSSDVPTVCPVCATRPMASVVHIGAELANRRYLVCALCATEWNMTRIQCTSCESDKGVAYLALDGGAAAGPPAVRAETCSECHSYLKIVDRSRDPYADPLADDLATLALDVLVDEQGFLRTGPNLLFHPGSA
jgi:FdhE protein